MTRPVEVVIDELVLRGIDPLQAPVVTAALQARLARLASLPGLPPLAAREADVLAPPAVRTPADAPARLGERVADAVWAAVTSEAQR